MRMIEIINTSVGKFIGYSKDYLFTELKSGRLIEQNILNYISNNINKNYNCIEIGANIGAISIHLSKFCNKLYCFEPQQNIYLALCGNLFLNQCYNVIPINCAAFYENCKFIISPDEKQDQFVGSYSKGYEFVNSFGSIAIEKNEQGNITAQKIDDIIHDKIDFIKSDAEGGDLSAIMGAKNIIMRDNPVIIFEYHSALSEKCYNQTWSDYIAFFDNIGYLVEKFDESNYIARKN